MRDPYKTGVPFVSCSRTLSIRGNKQHQRWTRADVVFRERLPFVSVSRPFSVCSNETTPPVDARPTLCFRERLPFYSNFTNAFRVFKTNNAICQVAPAAERKTPGFGILNFSFLFLRRPYFFEHLIWAFGPREARSPRRCFGGRRAELIWSFWEGRLRGWNRCCSTAWKTCGILMATVPWPVFVAN